MSSCRGKEPSQAAPPVEVLVAEVQQRDVPTYAQWIGTLDGFVNAQIRAQVTGYLLTQDYKEGAVVHKGDVLFHIDPRTYQAAVDQAIAHVARDVAQSKYADLEETRLTLLYAKGGATHDELDAAVSAAEAAHATIKADEAAVAIARVNLGYCEIVSPVDGVAGLVAAQVGDLVGPTGPVLTTVSTIDPIKAFYTLSEQEYLEIRKQYPTAAALEERKRQVMLQLIFSTGDAYPYVGRVYGLQREVDVRTGTIQIVGLFPNPANLLRPGQFARVRRWDVQKGALLVPQRAVMDIQGIYQVAVVDADNKVHLQTVQVGDRVGSWWRIMGGLSAKSPGQRVVAEGVQKVREGQIVTPRPFVEARDSGIPNLPHFAPATLPSESALAQLQAAPATSRPSAPPPSAGPGKE
jgi:membrane fusion protein (multidrug efflux system)